MDRIDEINARLAEIENEIDDANEEKIAELDKEVTELTEERNSIMAKIEARKALRASVAAGKIETEKVEPAMETKNDVVEERGKAFLNGERVKFEAEQARSTLVSGGTLITPAGTETEIQDIPGAKYSSIIDMVDVQNCVGMGSNVVPIISADMSEASDQTEGSGVNVSDPTFATVTISAGSVLCLSRISKQAKKQSPVQYERKVTEQALMALRKKAAKIVTTSLLTDTNSLLATENAKVNANGKGVVDAQTLRTLVLAYGGDESVVGGAVLFLNKTDLVAFGDVRGTNEKKAVYEIIPDTDNPNTGIIKDGGLAVRYCINSNLTACAGTAQEASTGAAKKTMFYGNPKLIELDLFSDYEVKVSEDYAFNTLMDTIRGDVELGAQLKAKNGFVCLTIPKAAAVG